MVTGFISIKAAFSLVSWMPNWCAVITASVLSPIFALLVAQTLDSVGEAYLERHPEKRNEHTAGRLPYVDWTLTAIPVVCFLGFVVPVFLEARQSRGLVIWEWPEWALWFPLVVVIVVGVAWLLSNNIKRKSAAN